MANDYTAVRGIQAPGTSVYGYRRGDAVDASVVENWALAVGDDGDVIEGDLPDADRPTPVMARPGPEANRAAWESWAVANGKDEQWAAEASQEDLEAVEADAEGEPAAEPDGTPGRPADSAKKADWVAYVSAHPQSTDADREWAAADSTTKADLQAWQPAGDTVAEAANDLTNG